jgi:hypothetical protein
VLLLLVEFNAYKNIVFIGTVQDISLFAGILPSEAKPIREAGRPQFQIPVFLGKLQERPEH